MSAPLDKKLDSPEQLKPQSVRGRNIGGGYRALFAYWGPALIISMAYMDPGNYGTDIQAGAAVNHGFPCAHLVADHMAIVLQYLLGKAGVATGKHPAAHG